MDLEASSPLSSEWTSVRISPGEDTVGQNVLAVRVLVTSEDSSSDTESDYGGSKAPSAKAYEERPWQLDSPHLQIPLSRHLSLREPLIRPVSLIHLEELQVMPDLQRANSLQSPTPGKHENWRRKFQSNSTPMNKSTLSPPKEPPPHPPSSWSSSSAPPSSCSLASVPGHTPERSSPPQVPAYKPHSQASRGDFSPTPIYLRRARAQGIAREIPLSLPHGPVLERAEYCLVSPGEGHTNPVEMVSEGFQEVEAPIGSTSSVREDPQPVVGKNRCLPSQKLAPRAAENRGEGSNGPRRGQAGDSELAADKKPGLKKLVLTQEQKTNLLDWSDCALQGMRGKTGALPSQERSENGRGGAPKPVCPSDEKLPAAREVLEEMHTPAVRSPRERERSVPPPKSPLRLIANAIGRFLLPSSEGGKKASPKSESKTLPTGRSQAFTRSFSLRKPSSSKDGDRQSPGRHMAKRASAFFSLASPTSKTAQASDLSLPDPALRTQSLPNRPSKMFPAHTSPPCSKIEDVPTLLEKVSLQETLPDAAPVPKKRTSLLSSLGLKDRSFESFFQECKQRKDIGDFFISPKEKGPLRNRVPSLEKLVQPLGGTSLGQVAHTPIARDASSGARMTEAASSLSSTTSSSSADDEADSQFAWRLKEKKMLRGRRKREKQLVKQEELKRLHKAQRLSRSHLMLDRDDSHILTSVCPQLLNQLSLKPVKSPF
ncbi:MICAL C-terminal-like protein isoform X3 [Nannospalax galili]|uniref:MICAL C-terminal-like protein isoform X3 n=1 Tax=Nannospalax galili TaxID=1026970 RepID=UPI00111C35B9|nr:MICAL C-terminal-like protein isoform X3 [Nannospalax galili]